MSAVAEVCSQLTMLSLAGCRKVTDAGVSKLGEGCRQLRKLDLGSCSEVTDAGVSAVPRAAHS